MKKKVLIWNDFDLHERAGGPATYLYHLRAFFRENTAIDVSFLIDNKEKEKTTSTSPKPSIWPTFLRNLVRVNQNLKRNLKTYHTTPEKKPKEPLSSYDLIHFHTTTSLFKALPLLKNYKGKVMLTSHTPLAPHIENRGSSLNSCFILPKTKRKLQKIDEIAFKAADVLLFPTKEAMEPYFSTWPKFKRIIAKKEIIFVPTGVPEAKEKRNKEDVYKELNLPADAVLICYAGRHNKVKGFDLLKAFGKRILEKNENVYFVVLGKEFPIKGLSHKRWIEIGWTTDVYSYINASFLFVLPNKQTYFDLILLEAISLGKRVMLSETGGNKFFKALEGKGFDYFKSESVSDMVETFNGIDFTTDYTDELKHYYQQNFNLSVFGNNYMEAYLSVIN